MSKGVRDDSVCSVCCPYVCKMCVWTLYVCEAHVRDEGCEIPCVCSVGYAALCMRRVWYLGACGVLMCVVCTCDARVGVLCSPEHIGVRAASRRAEQSAARARPERTPWSRRQGPEVQDAQRGRHQAPACPSGCAAAERGAGLWQFREAGLGDHAAVCGGLLRDLGPGFEPHP